jgi:hypothetical protein
MGESNDGTRHGHRTPTDYDGESATDTRRRDCVGGHRPDADGRRPDGGNVAPGDDEVDPGDSPSRGSSLDGVVRTLAVPRRRRILEIVATGGEHGEPDASSPPPPGVDVTTVIDRLVERRPDAEGRTGGRGARSVRRRVGIELRHVDLPSLDAAGLVIYDRDADVVRLPADPSAVDDGLASLEAARGTLRQYERAIDGG